MRFLGLCYHYILPEERGEYHRRIFANSQEQFHKQVALMEANFSILSPEEIHLMYTRGYLDKVGSKQRSDLGIVFTFDDGLQCHYETAKYLAHRNIKGLFFIPTCLITEESPANPVIIHYGLALFGIKKFLLALLEAFDSMGYFSDPLWQLLMNHKKEDVWDIILSLKEHLKYEVPYAKLRPALVSVYEHLMVSEYPEIFRKICLTKEQILEIVQMGHTIGSHTHTHLSIAPRSDNSLIFDREVWQSKLILEEFLDQEVDFFSYPFGHEKDCLSESDLRLLESYYKYAFTVDEKTNDVGSNPLLLGRYKVMSSDTPVNLLEKVNEIALKGKESEVTPSN